MKVRTIIKNIHDYAWVVSLIIFIFILVTIPFTIIAVQNKTTANTNAATLACTPYPPCFYAASSSKCVLPPQPAAGKSWCVPTPITQSCGIILLQNNATSVTASNQNAEACFWNAYQQCNSVSTAQNKSTTLSVVQNVNNSTITTTYATKLTTINGIPSCSISYNTNDVSSCTGVMYSAQTGLQFNSCDNVGTIAIPPTNLLSVTPSPSIVIPPPTCIPRPACLDATPPCEITMPVNGWCLTTPTPVATTKTCQTAADCSSNQICVAPGPIRIDPTTKQPISIKYCYNKGTPIPL